MQEFEASGMQQCSAAAVAHSPRSVSGRSLKPKLGRQISLSLSCLVDASSSQLRRQNRIVDLVSPGSHGRLQASVQRGRSRGLQMMAFLAARPSWTGRRAASTAGGKLTSGPAGFWRDGTQGQWPMKMRKLGTAARSKGQKLP